MKRFAEKYLERNCVKCEMMPGNTGEVGDCLLKTIPSRSAELKALKRQNAANLCLTDTIDALNRMLAYTDSDIERFSRAAQEMEDKKSEMKLKGEVAALEAKHLLENALFEDIATIHEYADSVIGSVDRGLDPQCDTETAVNNIPAYLKDAWEDFAVRYGESMQEKSKAVFDEVSDRLKRDISEFLSSIPSLNEGEMEELFNGVQINGYAVNFDPSESDMKTRTDKIAKILMIGAIPAALLINLPTGLLLLGGAFAVNPIMSRKINADEKKTAMVGVRKSCFEISENLKRDITAQIEKLTGETEQYVRRAYEHVLCATTHAIFEKMETTQNACQNREKIKRAISDLSDIATSCQA